MKERPTEGGIVALLRFIAIASVIAAIVGTGLAGVALSVVFIVVTAAVVSASILWAISSAIQELRHISFNTRRDDDAEQVFDARPVDRGAEPASMFNAGGMR